MTIDTQLQSSVVLHLDSRFSQQIETGKTTNFIYTLKEAIEVPETQLCEVSLYTATIPYSFYNVRFDVNDTFTLHYNGGSTTLRLPRGNYSATALKNRFQTLVTACGAADVSTFVFDTDYSRETLKFTFTLTTDIAHTLGVTWGTTAPLFGFLSGSTTYTWQPMSGSTHHQLESNMCIDINDSIHGLYVRQNLSTKSTLDNENGTFSNILARIPINTNPGGVIFHNPANSTHKAVTSVHSIQTIGCKLTDDNNRAIDLNGLHWQISLLVTFIPRTPRLEHLTKVTRRISEMNDLAIKRRQQQLAPPRKLKTGKKSKRDKKSR